MIYPNDFINKVITGDCLKVMKQIPDKSIDLVLTDPPYGTNYLSSRTKNHTYLLNDKLSDWIAMLPQMFIEFKRILTDTGCCCCCCGGGKTPGMAIFTIEAIKHFNLIQTLVWRKFIGLGWRYRPAYETIVILSKDKNNYSFYDKTKSCSNVIEGINQDIPRKGEHPTQKPVELMKHLIQIHSQFNDLVLDAFAGSGSTLVAAKELGRRFIGIEIEPKYVEICNRRLAQEVFDFNKGDEHER
jgi:DNA modification methylase